MLRIERAAVLSLDVVSMASDLSWKRSLITFVGTMTRNIPHVIDITSHLVVPEGLGNAVD